MSGVDDRQTEPARPNRPPLQLSLAVGAVVISLFALVIAVIAQTRQSAATGTTISSSSAPGTCDARAVAAKTMPSVVTLFVRGADNTSSNGSGEFLDQAGNILTNNHVISSAVGGGSITVVRPNGEELPATLVGRDPQTDLAVVKVTPKAAVQPVTFGNVPVIGQSVFAVGAPMGLTETFTAGVVSGLNRSVRVPSDAGSTALLVAAIQTDAAINPGNSGGLLADCSGDLVGVPTAGATANDSQGQPVAGSIGLGFAVPAATAHRVADELISHGSVRHGDFGISVAPVGGPTSMINPSGLYITDLTAGGPAAQAGLQRGDIIVAIDGAAVTSADQLAEISLTKPANTKITLKVQREGKMMEIPITLG